MLWSTKETCLKYILMQIDSKKRVTHRFTIKLVLIDLLHKRSRLGWTHAIACNDIYKVMKNCQEIGSSIVGGGGSSPQCSYTITMFLLTQVEHSIIIYVSRSLCNKNVARDNLRLFRTNSSRWTIFTTFRVYFKIEPRGPRRFILMVRLHVGTSR